MGTTIAPLGPAGTPQTTVQVDYANIWRMRKVAQKAQNLTPSQIAQDDLDNLPRVVNGLAVNE